MLRPQKMTDFVTPPPIRKNEPDLLLKNNRIRKHVTNFRTHPFPFRVDVIELWSISAANQNANQRVTFLLSKYFLIICCRLFSFKMLFRNFRNLSLFYSAISSCTVQLFSYFSNYSWTATPEHFDKIRNCSTPKVTILDQSEICSKLNKKLLQQQAKTTILETHVRVISKADKIK